MLLTIFSPFFAHALEYCAAHNAVDWVAQLGSLDG